MPHISGSGNFAWMPVTKDPTGATSLYEEARMHVERRKDTYEEELRPVKDRS